MRVARMWSVALTAALVASFATPVRAANSPKSLQGVTVPTAGAAWAVGGDGAIERWDGSAWTASRIGGMYSPVLTDVDAVGAKDAWLVGRVTKQDQWLGIAYHWDGGAWTKSATPRPTGEVFPTGVAMRSSDDVWAVGYRLVSGVTDEIAPFVWRWNGSTWASVAPPPGVQKLLAVDTVGKARVWAVGVSSTGAGVAVQWTGSRWARFDLPHPAGTLVQAADVASTDRGTWVAGAIRPDPQRDPAVFHPYVARYSKGSWTIEKRLGGGKLHGLSVPATGAAWAVGSAGSHVLVLKRTASGWVGTAAPTIAGTSALLDVDVRTGAHAFAVGRQKRAGQPSVPLMLRWNGTAWKLVALT